MAISNIGRMRRLLSWRSAQELTYGCIAVRRAPDWAGAFTCAGKITVIERRYEGQTNTLAGAEVMVCGQFLGAMRIDPKTLSPDVNVASEAFLTLITDQNNGYTVLEF